jgi:hypothetical protein
MAMRACFETARLAMTPAGGGRRLGLLADVVRVHWPG